MKTLILTLFTLGTLGLQAQTLEKMQWFNEPEQWEINGKTLNMSVTPHSDYWRISHYGFTVDDAPFYYTTYGGEFEVKVKITGDYTGASSHLTKPFLTSGSKLYAGKMPSKYSILLTTKPIP